MRHINIVLRMDFGGRAILTGSVLFGLAASTTHAVDGGDIDSLAAWVDGVEVPPITRWQGGDPRIRYSTTLPLTPVGVDYARLIIDCTIAPAQTSRSESGRLPNDRMTLTYWKRDRAEADLRLYSRVTGVEVSLSVIVTRLPKATK